MFTNLQPNLPDQPKISGTPDQKIEQLTSYISNIKTALNAWIGHLNAPGGLSVVQSGVWTPTPTSAGGTLTTAAATGRYWKLQDDLYFYYIEVTITTAGTGTGAVNVTLPFTITDDMVGVGADVAVTFKGATITAGLGGATAKILGADGATLIADGAVLRCMGMWVVED